MLRSVLSANRTCTGLSSLPTTCVAIYALAEFGNGRAPRSCPEYLADPNGADCCLPRARTHRVLLKWTRTPDSHRVNSVLQTDGSTTLPCARFLKVGRPTGLAPARRLSQSRMLTLTSWSPFETDPPAGAAPAWSALRVRCIADLCHGGIEMVLPPRRRRGIVEVGRWARKGLAPRTSAFAERRAGLLHLGSLKSGASCRSCPGAVSLEETRAAVTPMTLFEDGGCVRYRAGLSSSSARR